MKVCVIGAGAIGGLMAARLASQSESPATVCLLARGATLNAIRSKGIQWFEREPNSPSEWLDRSVTVHASDDPAELGHQDLVIVAVKYNAMEQISETIAPLIGPETVVLSAMNGVPWWFGHGQAGIIGSLTLDEVDRNSAVSLAIPPERVVGCVVHLAASARSPAVIQLSVGNRLIIGEPSGQQTDRVSSIGALLTAAGFDVEQSESIHRELWYKLWGNMTVNPISAVTGAKTDAILNDPALRTFVTNAMHEAKAIATKLDLTILEEPEQRHEVTARLGGFKTSMLQDAEAGRPLELDALVTIVHSIAEQIDVPTPNITALLGITRVFAQTHQLR